MTIRLVSLAPFLALLCLAPPTSAQVSFRLSLVDRAGTAKDLGTLPPGTFAPRVSPDGKQIAFDAQGAIWIADLNNIGTPRRVATGAFPMWSGDGARVLFIVGQGEQQQMFWQAADGSGQPELLIADARAPESWSASAQVLTYITLKGTNYDVQAYSLRDRSSTPLAARPDSLEMGSRFSPDGRWIAYESSETGMREIYVEPFPQTGARTKVTTGGGRRPLWSPDGREIFFDRDDAQLYVVPLTLGSTVAVGATATLPIKGFVQGQARRMYDVTPDGTHFLMLFR
jgi:eukaryotic-like serine/threonine-protein kinase